MNASRIGWLLLAVLVAGPTLICLISQLVPLVVVVAAAAGALRVVWFYTRR